MHSYGVVDTCREQQLRWRQKGSCPVLNVVISVPRIVIVTTELVTISFLKKEGFKSTLKGERSHPLVPGQGAGYTAGGCCH